MNHNKTPLEGRLMHRSCSLKAYQVRLSMWRRQIGNMDAWPRTPEQLKKAMLDEATSSDLKALQELDQQGMNENEQSNIRKRVAQLTKGGSKLKLPKAPPNISELFTQDPEANSDVPYKDQDAKYWQKKYPSLDLETAEALIDQADSDWPDSRFPKHILVPIGAHYMEKDWTVAELQQWCSSFSEPKKTDNLTSTEKAQLYATLADRVLQQLYQSSDKIGEMMHLAELLQVLPLPDLQRELEQAGVEVSDDDDDKASVIVALVQHMYADVLPKTAPEAAGEPKKKDAKRVGGVSSAAKTAKRSRA